MRFSEFLLAAVFAAAFSFTSMAQGGWRQWEIHLRDGSRLEANPLGIKLGKFTRSMNEQEPGIERASVSYLAGGGRELPPLPKGRFKNDVVVMLDGRKVVGFVEFHEIKFSEGTYLQNGREGTLENVAYIIFRKPRKE